MQFVFIVWQVEGYRSILKPSWRPLAFTSNWAFLKNKKRSGTSLLAFFSHNFCRKKYFSCYILLIEQISLSGCLYFVRYSAICLLKLLLNQVVTSWILKLPLSFYSSCFSYMTKMSWQNLIYLEKEKSF